MEATLQDADPAVYATVRAEIGRQQDDLELIASENYVSRAVLDALGSPLTNKYAEGDSRTGGTTGAVSMSTRWRTLPVAERGSSSWSRAATSA